LLFSDSEFVFDLLNTNPILNPLLFQFKKSVFTPWVLLSVQFLSYRFRWVFSIPILLSLPVRFSDSAWVTDVWIPPVISFVPTSSSGTRFWIRAAHASALILDPQRQDSFPGLFNQLHRLALALFHQNPKPRRVPYRRRRAPQTLAEPPPSISIRAVFPTSRSCFGVPSGGLESDSVLNQLFPLLPCVCSSPLEICCYRSSSLFSEAVAVFRSSFGELWFWFCSDRFRWKSENQFPI